MLVNKTNFNFQMLKITVLMMLICLFQYSWWLIKVLWVSLNKTNFQLSGDENYCFHVANGFYEYQWTKQTLTFRWWKRLFQCSQWVLWVSMNKTNFQLSGDENYCFHVANGFYEYQWTKQTLTFRWWKRLFQCSQWVLWVSMNKTNFNFQVMKTTVSM